MEVEQIIIEVDRLLAAQESEIGRLAMALELVKLHSGQKASSINNYRELRLNGPELQFLDM